CREGGAIALGHPWGASGAVAMVRLFGQLVRHDDGPDLGLACAAIGGGMGIAVLVERVGRRVSDVVGDEGAARAASKTSTPTISAERVGRRVSEAYGSGDA